ncbi:hypothetical protein GGU11DRAFT_121455 [Lentinula aff. detonsa]|uniref:Transmembrane protein n=1 Tax=Lentinula aff. detonsa TaxID=2804958 RepID=A0AA38NSF0_9AGAR|nr:hypothetical protein GGU10DRAFT_190484 [Lentinula aff. detonsa]KAJ3801931.1 hypothetical protein GGU11DRAFT_121455 [Lentinula aff. detonsa]
MFIMLISIIFDFSILSYAVHAASFARSESTASTNNSVLSRQVLTAIVVGLCISVFAVSLFLAASGCKFCRRRRSIAASPPYSNGRPINDPHMQGISGPISESLLNADSLPLYESHRLPAYSHSLRQVIVPTGPPFPDRPSTPPPAHVRF